MCSTSQSVFIALFKEAFKYSYYGATEETHCDERTRFCVLPLLVLVYAVLMGYVKADSSLPRLFTGITLFFFFWLLPVWLFRHKGCTNYTKRDTREKFIWSITNEVKPCCTGRIRVIDRWIGEIWWRAVNSRWGCNLYGALPFFFLFCLVTDLLFHAPT